MINATARIRPRKPAFRCDVNSVLGKQAGPPDSRPIGCRLPSSRTVGGRRRRNVLYHFERVQREDPRPAKQLMDARLGLGEVRLRDAHKDAFASNSAAWKVSSEARFAAVAAGRPSRSCMWALVSSVRRPTRSGHRVGQRRASATTPPPVRSVPGNATILVLVLVDQRQRNEICWDIFAC